MMVMTTQQPSEFCTSKCKLLSHLEGKGVCVWHSGAHAYCRSSKRKLLVWNVVCIPACVGQWVNPFLEFFVLGNCISLPVWYCCLKLPLKLYLRSLVWFAVLHWFRHSSFWCFGVILLMSKYETKYWFEYSALIHYPAWGCQHVQRKYFPPLYERWNFVKPYFMSVTKFSNTFW